MSNYSASGKWILLGEHAVVRGKPALVFPLVGKKFSLCVQQAPTFQTNIPELKDAILKILATAEKLTNKEIGGNFNFIINNEIPLQAGLGSSAALSVAFTNWLTSMGLVKDSFSFALALENIFHGESSGLDVAAIFENAPLKFQRGQIPQKLNLCWQPNFYLVDSGLRSSTKDAVAKVSAMSDPFLDSMMEEAVIAAFDALTIPGENNFEQLAKAIHLGEKCFSRWELIPPKVKELSEKLFRAGATAIKPTGSGNGGYILSLWKNEPNPETIRKFGLIKAL